MSTRVVSVNVQFYVTVTASEELKDRDACSAADIATHEALSFVRGNEGYDERTVEETEVHVDGFGGAIVAWPAELFADMIVKTEAL